MTFRQTTDFLLYDWLAVESLRSRARFADHSRETFAPFNMIHEGTHGIQALDLLGRKVVMDGGKGRDRTQEKQGDGEVDSTTR